MRFRHYISVLWSININHSQGYAKYFLLTNKWISWRKNEATLRSNFLNQMLVLLLIISYVMLHYLPDLYQGNMVRGWKCCPNFTRNNLSVFFSFHLNRQNRITAKEGTRRRTERTGYYAKTNHVRISIFIPPLIL